MSAESLDSVNSQTLHAKMVANGHDIQFQLDSGATVNVLPAREYKEVCDDPELKVYMTDFFFICSIKSPQCAGKCSKKVFSTAIFLSRVLN